MSGPPIASFLALGLMALMTGGCAALGIERSTGTGAPEVSVERRPDPAEVRLAEAAERAEAALTMLARIQTAEALPPPAGLPLEVPGSSPGPGRSPVPQALQRPVTLDWIGPLEALAETLATQAGYRFVAAGPPPVRPLMVAVAAEETPLVEVLRDAGMQAGSAATLVVDASRRTVRLDWPAPGSAER
ncbi:MAG: DotD/TraH family lipoprotein [Alphaproteobacteria bacterium]|nr:DotD/TraH family lipoprotein [Alphaproteobacteria bacterium]